MQKVVQNELYRRGGREENGVMSFFGVRGARKTVSTGIVPFWVNRRWYKYMYNFVSESKANAWNDNNNIITFSARIRIL